MGNKRLLLTIILILAMVLSFSGCVNNKNDITEEVKSYQKIDEIFGTIVTAVAYGENAEEALQKAFDKAKEIENIMSVKKEDSEISYVNNNAAKGEVNISDELFYVIKEGLNISYLSKGAFDISIGKLIDLWGIGTDSAKIPTEEELNMLKQQYNYKNIILNEGTKGKINYIDENNKKITLYIDRIKFNENNEELSLIEIKDISKYKNLLSELEASTSEYKTLIDTIPEAICVLDYESKEFEYANNTFFDIFKIQDIENMDFDEIYNDLSISSGNINESIKYIRKTLKDGYGNIINIESSVVLIDVNKSTKMVLIIRDITEEIKVESMKKEIEERENIIKDRDEFFINMSHELLTPANLLHTSNQFIERICKDIIKREPKGEFANCIAVMKKHVEILITLINKMMELSKLESNYYKNNKVIYEIVSLCEDIVTELNKHTINKNINILFDTNEEEAYVEIDPGDISKAILTILSVVVKNSRVNSTINFNIKIKENKVTIEIENLKQYDYKQHLNNYEDKILSLSMSIAKLIVNMYKGKIDLKTNQEDSILIEIELHIEKNMENNQKITKTIDENFIYNEYKNICYL